MDENRVMKEFRSVKKILGHQIVQLARNRGHSTESFSKMNWKIKIFKTSTKRKTQIQNNDNITKLDQCPCQDSTQGLQFRKPVTNQ